MFTSLLVENLPTSITLNNSVIGRPLQSPEVRVYDLIIYQTKRAVFTLTPTSVSGKVCRK